MFIARELEFSFEDTNINGLFKALDKPKLSKDEFDDIGSFSVG